ncbi:hypothetical protein GTA51_19175 [Desulfovibrio aerotolerans]|uniref:Uncharacterized protein n=1 Tax=Solidesulfovibrio aerotolerans TaxID=295255 RepID=A0A7C9IWX5_9BACT|nr:hypothetical protein [Solidesulfovibrio aerotolerans]MYL85223.1 hypothetical protein [Solidesulfovibrio aerotolerans]
MKFENFQIGEKTFCAVAATGTVLDIKTISETHVHGSGGGGTISTDHNGNIYGYSSRVSIGSFTTIKTTAWIKTEEGREIEIKLPIEMPARVGHKVALVGIDCPDTNEIMSYSFVNITTEKIENVTSIDELTAFFDLKLPHESLFGSLFLCGIVGVFIAGISAIVIGGLLRSWFNVDYVSHVFWVTIGLSILVAFIRNLKVDTRTTAKQAKINSEFISHIRSAIQTIMSK